MKRPQPQQRILEKSNNFIMKLHARTPHFESILDEMYFFSNNEVQRQYETPDPRRIRHSKQKPPKSRDNSALRVMGGAILILLFLAMVAIVIYFMYFGKKWWRHDPKTLSTLQNI